MMRNSSETRVFGCKEKPPRNDQNFLGSEQAQHPRSTNCFDIDCWDLPDTFSKPLHLHSKLLMLRAVCKIVQQAGFFFFFF